MAPAVEERTPLRPILKWAGGKSKLLPQILAKLPEEIGTFYEPFVGGGAVFFALANQRRFARAVISDLNGDLVEVYRGVKANVKGVIVLLQEHALRHGRDHYYDTRGVDVSRLDRCERAARLIYLNKTGYNGLYRVNRSGQFNVPFGRYKNPTICDEPRLRAASRALKGVQILHGDFEQSCASAEPGDAVYFDPPYVPLSRTASFTAYHSEEFGEAQHRKLAKTFLDLKRRKVRAVLSNSDTELTRDLYDRRSFEAERVWMARAINSKSSKRGDVQELLVSNRVP